MATHKKKAPSLTVWLDDPAFGPNQQIGTLYKVGHDGVRFGYAKSWLQNPAAFQLDPALSLDSGDFYPVDSNFGVFLDSCPDRWGQVLMQRRETLEAKEAGRAARILGPWDFLCGVQDHTRMGALRFSSPDSDVYLANELLSAPPVTMLSELQRVAYELSRKRIVNVAKLSQWLTVLVAPGASLGGARPKANVVEKGDLWIAKFPAADDDRDVGLWEKLLSDMAAAIGIRVPAARVVQIGNGYHTFMVKRFDRVGASRKFFTSAMTVLNRTDKDQTSYIDIASFIAVNGPAQHISADLKELYRRVAFNIATANRDDHLRNHGFMKTPEGWRLSDAFDMNPSAKKLEHVLGITDGDHEPSLVTLLGTAEYYRLSDVEADRIIKGVVTVVSTWKTRAKQLGIAAVDIHEMNDLFVSKFD